MYSLSMKIIMISSINAYESSNEAKEPSKYFILPKEA
jgi:hypothetical protein